MVGGLGQVVGMLVVLAGPPSPHAAPMPAAPADAPRPRPTHSEEVARTGTIALAVVTAVGLGATIVGAVFRAGAPSRQACATTGVEGPTDTGACNRRWVGNTALVVGIPVTVLAATGTGLLGHRWRRLRNERLELGATGLSLRF